MKINVTLERVGENNLFHHDRSYFLPEMYPDVDEDGYYDKTNTIATMQVSSDKAQSYLIRYDGKI